jgi:hypothetical protein
MTAQELYSILAHNELFRSKISLVSENCVELQFIDYLNTLVFVDEIDEECYVEYNLQAQTHCHIDIEDIIEYLINLANGNLVFIDRKRFLSKRYYIICIVSKDFFEKHKKFILWFKSLRVYSAVEMLN